MSSFWKWAAWDRIPSSGAFYSSSFLFSFVSFGSVKWHLWHETQDVVKCSSPDCLWQCSPCQQGRPRSSRAQGLLWLWGGLVEVQLLLGQRLGLGVTFCGCVTAATHSGSTQCVWFYTTEVGDPRFSWPCLLVTNGLAELPSLSSLVCKSGRDHEVLCVRI